MCTHPTSVGRKEEWMETKKRGVNKYASSSFFTPSGRSATAALLQPSPHSRQRQPNCQQVKSQINVTPAESSMLRLHAFVAILAFVGPAYAADTRTGAAQRLLCQPET